MNTITYSQRYLPHEISTKYYAVKLYRTGVGVSFVCRRYHISKSFLMRRNKKFDGSKASLLDKSRRPRLSIPMNTNEELKWIHDYHTHAKNIYLGIVWQTLHCKRLFLASQLLKTQLHSSTMNKCNPKPFATPFYV